MTANDIPLIAHVIFRLDVGGLENGLVNLINGLPRNEFRHAIICIDTFTDFKKRLDRSDIEIVAIRKKPGIDLGALWRLYKVFRRLKPSIVHTRNLAALDALLPAMLAGVRSRIHSEHGWGVNDVSGTNQKLILLRKFHAPLIQRQIALSKDLQRYLVDKIGIPVERITQLYNGVATDKFGPSPSKKNGNRHLIEKFGEKPVLVGTVGRMEAVKDPMNLVDAYILLIQRTPELANSVRLVMIGDGALRHSVLLRLKDAGLDDVTWIPGARNDIAEILRSLDVYVQPSLAEGVSNTILEAMASGLPVIATDVGGSPELVINKVTGMIVPPANAAAIASSLEYYVNDPNIRTTHGAAARLRVDEHFTIDVMLRKYADIYRKLVK